MNTLNLTPHRVDKIMGAIDILSVLSVGSTRGDLTLEVASLANRLRRCLTDRNIAEFVRCKRDLIKLADSMQGSSLLWWSALRGVYLLLVP